MKIVIVEDETMVARRIELFCERILKNKLTLIRHFYNLEDADDFLNDNEIDLLLLDLNLNNRDGFDLLKGPLAASYYTIVISANTDRAIQAFELGVLDFVAKPFKIERLAKAFSRLEDDFSGTRNQVKFLSIKKYGRIELIDIDEILYIQAASHYSEITFTNGTKELHDKNLEKLMRLLPSCFVRVHKSYAVDSRQIGTLHRHPGTKYELELKDKTVIPLGRTYYPKIKTLLA